ncbi:MAG: hypothetical protein GF398_00440 [Chitinivibrionales bacterium]|nr:hypothetical protein [Chitinivibrionales bacterium]
MQISVETTIQAPVEKVWRAYTTAGDIKQWNRASDDWHTPSATVDFRQGGQFCSRMEAKDGSMGFDFAGTYTKIIEYELIEYTFGGRKAKVKFSDNPGGITVRIHFEGDSTHSIEQQRIGWQSILNSFKKHVEASGN